MSFQPVDRSVLPRQVSEQIEQLILDGAIEVGQKLPSEKILGEQFGVSRNAVREALKRLEARGMVRVENGKGAFITRPSSDTVQHALGRYIQAQLGAELIDHLYEIRRVLEGAAAHACAERATAEDLARLRQALTRMEEHQDNVDRWLEADLAFHRALFASTHNPFFSMLLEPIVSQIGAAIKASYGVEAAHRGLIEHRAVLARIAAGDGPGARTAMLAVLEDSEARVQHLLEEEQT
ncbi:MAG TPA: FadR/GntR family transcriptional regulator [Chloroflexota bacterium]|nr:FadR/GntR family transcriptional regulator [Chloroflexota bacterium]